MKNKTIYRNFTFDDVWTKDFFAYLDEKAGARNHWNHLLFGGNPLFLTRIAFLALDHTIGLIELSRVDLKAFAQTIPAPTIAKIRATAELIKGVNHDLSRNSVKFSEASDLPEKMLLYADFIEGIGKVAIKLSSERLPNTGDYLLFFLHAYILKATGKPLWQEMATLLEAAGKATYRQDFEFDADCLRKNMKSTSDRDPYVSSHLQEKAEQYIKSGNNGWPSLDDLDRIAVDVANQLTEIPTGS